jgi:hypothetical protein
MKTTIETSHIAKVKKIIEREQQEYNFWSKVEIKMAAANIVNKDNVKSCSDKALEYAQNMQEYHLLEMSYFKEMLKDAEAREAILQQVRN